MERLDFVKLIKYEKKEKIGITMFSKIGIGCKELVKKSNKIYSKK